MNRQTGIDDLLTPCLLLDRRKMERNIRRMSSHVSSLGGVIRPHVKTNKSIDVTQRIIAGGNTCGITVSTLREAEYFLSHGIRDILYAVGVSPNKIGHAAQLIERGCDLKIILDHPDMVERVGEEGVRRGLTFKVLIELDVDGHRSGVKPDSEVLIEIGRRIEANPGTALLGVMTHAGESYFCEDWAAIGRMARQERDRAIHAAERLRATGLACPIVSIGSTPTALAIDDLDGVTEVRTGVYVFFDLVMAGLGVCSIDDIALSVLTSVIGYQEEKNWLITDAGWMAMSRDRGTATQKKDFGYGLVVDRDGGRLGDLIMESANQEHGIVSSQDKGVPLPYSRLPLGTLLRVLPNHSCATAGLFDHYHVIDGQDVVSVWERIRGW